MVEQGYVENVGRGNIYDSRERDFRHRGRDRAAGGSGGVQGFGRRTDGGLG
jgi:hypothetical protein